MSYFELAITNSDGQVLFRKSFNTTEFVEMVLGEANRLIEAGKIRQGQSYHATIIPVYHGQIQQGVLRATVARYRSLAGYIDVPTASAEVIRDDPDNPIQFFTIAYTFRSRETGQETCIELDVPTERLSYWTDKFVGGLEKTGLLKPGQPRSVLLYGRLGERKEAHSQVMEYGDLASAIANIELSDSVIESNPPAEKQARIRRECTRIGIPDPDDPIIQISRVALRRLKRHVRQYPDIEVGGLLLGLVSQDESGRPVVDICDAIHATSAPSDAVSITFNTDAWQELSRARANADTRFETVGWYHSHVVPESMREQDDRQGVVFFSTQDKKVHDHFRRPTDVALVIDSLGDDAAFFRWHGDSIRKCRGHYEYDAKEQ